MMKSKSIFTLSIIMLVLSVTAAITCAVAWFAGDLGSSSDTLIIYSGDIALNVGVYRGIDYNKDGVLDDAVDGSGEQVRAQAVYNHATDTTLPKSNRDAITTYMYSPIDKQLGEEYDEYIDGSSILLKIIVSNPSETRLDAEISVNFSDLGSYFFGNSGKSEAEISSIMAQYTARIMFRLDGLTARVYSSGNATDSFTQGYNTLVRSSAAADVGEGVTLIESLNAYSKNAFYLSEISSQESFLSGIRVNSGELVELDFKLTCLSTDEIYNSYSDYWDNYIAEHTELSAAEIQYITDMYMKELAFIVFDEGDNVLSLSFDIDKIYVYGTQVAREVG